MIGALLTLISLDVTEKLVAKGVIVASLAIVGATATTPIVIETSEKHGFQTRIHAAVSGINGIPRANDTWELEPIDQTHFALYTYLGDGERVPSVGVGAYVSGGVAQTALDGGRIRIGRRWVRTNGRPPRITAIPHGAPAFDLNSYGGQADPIDSFPRTIVDETTELQTEALALQIITERHRVIFEVWGCAFPPDPDLGDFDVTQMLRNQIFETLFRLCSARWLVIGGKWTSQDENAPKWDSLGQKYEAVVEIQQPVTDAPLAYVSRHVNATITIAPTNASSDDPIVIVTPPVS